MNTKCVLMKAPNCKIFSAFEPKKLLKDNSGKIEFQKGNVMQYIHWSYYKGVGC